MNIYRFAMTKESTTGLGLDVEAIESFNKVCLVCAKAKSKKEAKKILLNTQNMLDAKKVEILLFDSRYFDHDTAELQKGNLPTGIEYINLLGFQDAEDQENELARSN